MNPPDDLPAAALDVWRRVVPLVAETVALRETDLDALRQYCEAVALRARALKELAGDGVPLVCLTPNGAQQVNPLLKIVSQADSIILKLSERFGLDPASRKRLQIAAQKQATPFLDFLKSKPGREKQA